MAEARDESKEIYSRGQAKSISLYVKCDKVAFAIRKTTVLTRFLQNAVFRLYDVR